MRPLTKHEKLVHSMLKCDARERATVLVSARHSHKIYRDAYAVVTARTRIMALEFEIGDVTLRRKAYICVGGQIKHTNDLGFTTLVDAFTARPMDCKYCVFELGTGKALLVDMFELVVTRKEQAMAVKSGAARTFETIAAAIMYALAVE